MMLDYLKKILFIVLNLKFLFTEVLNQRKKSYITKFSLSLSTLKDTNPWLNIDASSPAKTRSLTSKKIEIKHSPNISMRVQNIAPYIEAEIASQMVSNFTIKT